MATVRNIGPAASQVKPPHSLEAEREVLSAVLVDPDAFETLLAALSATDFYFERHQALFLAMEVLHKRGTALDVVTLQQVLKDRNQYEKIGGARAIGELLDRAGTVSNLEHYIAEVRRKSLRRKVLDAGRAIEVGALSEYDDSEIDASIEAFERVKAERQQFLKPTEDWRSATLANLIAINPDADPPKVVSSGVDELDFYLPGGGYEGGNLIVIIGPPKTGKTTYALGTLTRRCCERGGRVLYCALSDAGLRRLNRKLLCGVSGVPDRAIKQRNLVDNQWSHIISAADKIAEWKLHIERNPDPRAIVSRAKQLAREEGGLQLVVVDYLQRTKSGAKEMWQDMAAATGVLQDGAVDLDIPFVVLSQPTTEARRTGKKIKASDTKGGGTAEEDGDLVMLLEKGTTDPSAAGLHILVGRDVEPRSWHAEAGVVEGKSVAACGWRWNYRSMQLEDSGRGTP